MTREPDKSSRFSGHLQENLRLGSFPACAAVLNVKSHPKSLPPRHARRCFRRDRHNVGEVLESRCSEANQELARLFREVSAVVDGAFFNETQRMPIKELLMRALRCATKQYMLQAELSDLALKDELTGLYNRRGFLAIAERQLKLARRTGRQMLLFFIDLDGLKQINDSFGHFEGDLAIKRVAQALKKTFRDADLLARVAGDEFVVLAMEASDHSEASIRKRLCEDLRAISAVESRYTTNLSMGVSRFNPREGTSIGELMAMADGAMYGEKRRSSASDVTGRIISFSGNQAPDGIRAAGVLEGFHSV